MSEPRFEFAPPTKNPLRAMAWVRVLNEWIYNHQESSPANTEDVERTFPGIAPDRYWTGFTQLETQPARSRLVSLRNRLVDHFDIPADGIAK